MSIRIKSLATDNLTERALQRKFLYKDLALDVKNEVFLNTQLNKSEALKDAAAIYDIESVKNSIATAFLTTPKDKILNPTYGVDLRRHLFEPIDDFIINIIQDDIESKLPVMEPRVKIVNVSVTGNEDENTIYIELQINVPSLNIYGVSIKSQLNSTGYSTL